MSKDSGMDAIFKALDSLPAAVEIKLTRKGLKKVAENLVAKVKAITPVRQGVIRTRVGTTFSKMKGGKFGRQGFKAPHTSISFEKPGDLRNSIAYKIAKSKKKGGVVATIGSGLFYARFVELGFMHKGGVHVPAQPFLTPVMESSMEYVGSELKATLASEVMREMGKAANSSPRRG